MKRKWIATIVTLAGAALPALAGSLDLTYTSKYYTIHPQIILARECGVDVDEVMPQSARKYFHKFARHGNVAYGNSLPEAADDILLHLSTNQALKMGIRTIDGRTIFLSNPVASPPRTARHENRVSL